MPKFSDEEIKVFEDILSRKLEIFEGYASGTRIPMSERAKHFVAVCEGRRHPRTLSEKAYLHHRRKTGRPVVHVGERLPSGLKTAPHERGRVWDNAVENMAEWKPWHD
jgi:hypothetical protein